MSLNRYAAKRDENERSIIDSLLKLGYLVYQLDQPVDLLVGRRGNRYWALLEVKMPGKKLTDGQVQFFQESEGTTRFIVHSAEEARNVCSVWIDRCADAEPT